MKPRVRQALDKRTKSKIELRFIQILKKPGTLEI